MSASTPAPTAAPAARPFTGRLVGALLLDASVYEELEADRGATMQAAVVVVLVAIGAGLGSGLRVGPGGFAVAALIALASWSLYAWIVYFFGTTILRGSATQTEWGEVARTVGFATAPRLLLVFRAVIGLDALVSLLAGLWAFAATIVAVRAALDVGTGRAAVVAIVASFAQLLITGFLLALQGI